MYITDAPLSFSMIASMVTGAPTARVRIVSSTLVPLCAPSPVSVIVALPGIVVLTFSCSFELLTVAVRFAAATTGFVAACADTGTTRAATSSATRRRIPRILGRGGDVARGWPTCCAAPGRGPRP